MRARRPMSIQDRIVEKASRVVPLGITSYRRDWGALCDAATLLGVPRDPLSQAAHEALTKAGMRGKRFRAWVAGGGAATLLGDITDPVAFNAVVRDAPPQIRADVADALAEAYTAAVASDKAALRKASETPSLPRKRKVTTPPRLDPCVPKGGARTWGRPATPFNVGDRVRGVSDAVVYHHPKHKAGLAVRGLVGSVSGLASVARDGSGAALSANRPVVVQFEEPRLTAHFEEGELELDM